MAKLKKYFERRETIMTPPPAPEVTVEKEIEGKQVYIIQPGCTCRINNWPYLPGDPVELTPAEAVALGRRVKLREEIQAEKNRCLRDARFMRRGA